MSEAVVLLGCGDVGPIHEPMSQYSELVRGTLAEANIRFAQIARVYSERGKLQPHGGAHGRLPPHMVSVITDCGFNVVSVAGNHAMDWGAEALLDTIELLRGMGIQAIGAGRNLAEAGSQRSSNARACASRCWLIARSCMRAMRPALIRRAWRRCAPRPVSSQSITSPACRPT